MGKRLQVRLLPNWTQAENPDGPATFYRTDSSDAGALQVSVAEYMGGKYRTHRHRTSSNWLRGQASIATPARSWRA